MNFDEKFEWDENKNTLNKEKHHIDFRQAALIWGNDYIKSNAKKVNGENRFFITGKLDDDILITVIFTVRGEKNRIISARSSSREERTEYNNCFP